MRARKTNGASAAYTPNMDAPTAKRRGNRAAFGLVLTLLLPPLGLAYLWRAGVFRTRGRMILTGIATLEMALILMLILPGQQLNADAPVPVAPAAATLAPDDGVVTALTNIDKVLAEKQAERDAAAGVERRPSPRRIPWRSPPSRRPSSTPPSIPCTAAARDTITARRSAARRAIAAR